MGPIERRQTPPPFETETARSEPFPPGTTIARYRLVSLIGSGAMGDVYRAHDRALDREVALKVLPPELVGDRERVHRFAHEARAASALSHPHIVTIHEVGHARPVVSVRPIGERPARGSEVHYISMELIEGQTLREALASPLPLQKKIELMAQVADGLAKAHGAGILHRDLKPDNIIVAREGYAKIVDFGLAKLIDTSWNPIGADSPTLRALTAHGELLGTPGYMAPEQVTGKQLDARADIFSFGCILYEAVAGVRAYEAESFVDTLYKIVHEDAAPIAGSPGELQRIVAKCLARNRDERYDSIRDVAIELHAWTRRGDLTPAFPRQPRRPAKLLLIAALIAIVPVLGFLLFRRSPGAAPAEPSVRRITSDGRATDVAISPDGRYIAYVTADSRGYTLWLEQLATGRALAVVPATDGHYAGITFSRDGEYLYYTRYDRALIADLHRISILGGDAQRIVHDIDSRVALSPDGVHLAFIRDDFNRATTTLLVANLDGSEERALLVRRLPDRLFTPAWSPDGLSLVAVQRGQLIEIAYPNGSVRTIETNAPFDAFRGVVWPERKRMIVSAATEDGSRFRLWSIDPSNGKATPMSSELTELTLPATSAEGALAALQNIRQANLFEVGVDANVQQLTSGIGASNGLTGVVWAGDRVVYASASDGKHDLWSMNAATREATRLTDDALFESQPRVAPDRSAILYTSGTVDDHAVWRVSPDGRDRKQLTSGPRDGDFAVSPDSKQLAWASLDTKTNLWGLWTMPLAGGPKHRITTRTSVLEQIRYADGGKSIVFTGYEDSKLRVFRIDPNGGTPTALLDGRAHSPSISPDGKSIAVTYVSANRVNAPLALVPVRGGEAKVLEWHGSMYRWHPSGRAISFVRDDNGRMDLWLQPLDGGEAKRLTQFNEGSITQYAWSADGKRAVVTHVVDSADVVLMR